jgi:hypothetical protein
LLLLLLQHHILSRHGFVISDTTIIRHLSSPFNFILAIVVAVVAATSAFTLYFHHHPLSLPPSHKAYTNTSNNSKAMIW